MPLIELTTIINAPIEECFDLSRSIDLHIQSTAGTNERAIAGVTSGLIGFGQQVTWRAKHFGITQNLTSKITAYEPPFHFRDEMLEGAFKMIKHDHFFNRKDGVTVMIDSFYFESPAGIFGRLFNRLILTNYLKKFLLRRNAMIKARAEGEHSRNE